MHITRTFAVVAAATLGTALQAAPAVAEPDTRLPDADLVCGQSTLTSSQWVALPGSGTLWVRTGELAGHYVILSDSHYWMPGYQAAPPATFTDLELLATRDLGSKTGLEEESLSCTFVSRWGDETDPDAFSVVGPISMVRVGP